MSIYVIADLHLSFNEKMQETKPMNIFGINWENHVQKIKQDWKNKVRPEDTVLLLGDFSWAMKLQDTINDFKFINSLPGKKVLLKGNHDYWWTTVKSMNKFLIENGINNIEFLHNNSLQIENKIICGTRGWALPIDETENSKKMNIREVNRLRLSIEDGIQKYGKDKEVIVCMHYPPITNINVLNCETTAFIQIMKEYNIKRCYYGHLHSLSINDAIEGIFDGVDLKLVSADGIDFKLEKI